MSKQDNIEKLSQTIAGLIDSGQRSLIREVLKGETINLAISLANTEAIVEAFQLAQQQVLLDSIAFGAVSEEALTSLALAKQAEFLSHINLAASTVQAETILGAIGGKSYKQIYETITSSTGLSVAQAETVLNTSMNVYSRSVNALMAKDMPKNTKYVYVGAIDDKTRDICLEMASAGALTRDEIDSAYSGAFSDGGGFNCRHRWARETSNSSKLINPSKAKDFIGSKKNFRPVTARGEAVG